MAQNASFFVADPGVTTLVLERLDQEFRRNNLQTSIHKLLPGVLEEYGKEIFMDIAQHASQPQDIDVQFLKFLTNAMVAPKQVKSINQRVTEEMKFVRDTIERDIESISMPMLIGVGLLIGTGCAYAFRAR